MIKTQSINGRIAELKEAIAKLEIAYTKVVGEDNRDKVVKMQLELIGELSELERTMGNT